jgi:hypothetical protein
MPQQLQQKDHTGVTRTGRCRHGNRSRSRLTVKRIGRRLSGGEIGISALHQIEEKPMNVVKVAIVIAAAATLAACTTTEKTASGAGIGAAVGAIASNSVGGAVAGALIGGFGTYLFETADGKCQYRNSRGRVYTTRCHWRR